ncbi:MAG: GAF domain-containing protein [Bacteroidales bacterium]|nr:GAF domain-containing protein [Bacteroidales bacterium]
MKFFRLLDQLGDYVIRLARFLEIQPKWILVAVRTGVQKVFLSLKNGLEKLRSQIKIISFEKRVAIAVTASAIAFICWQMFAYAVYQSLFIIVNLVFTASLALYVSRLLFRIREQRRDFDQRLQSLAMVRRRREAELQQVRAENDVLKQSLSKEKVYEATSESLINAIKSNKALRQPSDEPGHYILLSISQCFEICGGIIYLRDKNSENEELNYAGSYALDEKPSRLTMTADDALVGEVFRNCQPMYLADIPSENMRAITGLGRARELQMYILPISIDKKVIGIIEVASFVKLDIANLWDKVNEQLAQEI